MSGHGKRRIVDAHHHLWDLEACHYPWLMARGVKRFFGDPAPIQKNYLPSDLRDDAQGYELAASVHIQVGVAPGEELSETRWLQTMGDTHGLPTAIVAACELERADTEARLDAHLAYSRVRGVRQIVGRSAEEDAKTGSDALLDNPRWRDHLVLLAEKGLSFDLQLIPGQMARAAEAIAAAPHLDVALCHAGSPWDQSPQGLATWRAGLTRLAELPRVVCKLSGFGMFDHGWSVASIRPMVEACLEVFGVERCMFGSNFPVDKLHAGYDRVFGAYEDLAAGLPDTERDALFVDNAVRFYRLGA